MKIEMYGTRALEMIAAEWTHHSAICGQTVSLI